MPTEILLRVEDHPDQYEVFADGRGNILIIEEPYVQVTLLSAGEAVVVVDHEDAKRVWDEMLANGRKTRAEYEASKRPDGTHRWPWGREETDASHWRIVETDMAKGEARALLAPEPGDRAVDPMLRRRLFRLDLAALPAMQRGRVATVDAATLRAAKEDAPKRADPFVL